MLRNKRCPDPLASRHFAERSLTPWIRIVSRDPRRIWPARWKGVVGDMAGDADTQAAGRVREAAGKVQNLYGQAKDAARDAVDDALLPPYYRRSL
jgi:uncharacterized protein YjbJ (UPF0337 family)